MAEITGLLIIMSLVLTVAWIIIPFILIGINKKAQRIVISLEIISEQLSSMKKNKNADNDSEIK